MENMSTETTPLQPTSSSAGIITSGPSYVFPGVSPRSRRRQMRQFQFCMCTAIMIIIGIALIIAISYSEMNDIENGDSVSPDDTEDDIIPDPLNMTELVNYMLNLKQPLKDENPTKWSLEIPTNQLIEDAKSFGTKALGDKEMLEENIQTTPVNSPAFRHYKAISTTSDGRKLARRGYVEFHATIHVARNLKYNKAEGRNNIGNGPNLTVFRNESEYRNCPMKYRSDDGFCNNNINPEFGSSMKPFRRAVAPDYSDGISLPRMAHSGSALPTARRVSLEIHRPSYSTDTKFTVMLAVFGQFLDHDITATALSSGQEGESINCCTEPLNTHPECYPVILLPGDVYFDFYNVSCMNFVRSAAAATGRLGPREQLNQATAFIDGSVVYGSTFEKINLLRDKRNGSLRMFLTPDNRQLLPLSSDPSDGCNREDMNRQGKYCFDAGDNRANENLLLTSMHLLFARNHNFLANGLKNVNPYWSDEKIFQECRKILAAQMQHITFNEFLPVLLGEDFSKVKGISSDMKYGKDMYDETLNPTIANHFASSVFRFAHTLLPGLVQSSRDNTTPEYIALHTMLFNPFSLWEVNGIDNVINGAINTPVLNVNPSVTKELSEKLFEQNSLEPNIPPLCGLDLVSLNIQRGRDHGLPSYSVFRRHCKLPPVDTWEKLETAINPTSYRTIRTIYESPIDVDLYTGALSEPPLEGAIFGPLLTCLVSDQFIRLKLGDSHWYERTKGPQRFTKAQLREIWKTSLGGLICQNSDNVVRVQKMVMQHRNDTTNPYVDCNEIKDFNFLPWSEEYVDQLLDRVKVSRSQSKVLAINGSLPNQTISYF